MSTKCSIVYLDDDDDATPLTHIYTECFDPDPNVYVQIDGPKWIEVACNERGRTVTICLPRARLLAIAEAFVAKARGGA